MGNSFSFCCSLFDVNLPEKIDGPVFSASSVKNISYLLSINWYQIKVTVHFPKIE